MQITASQWGVTKAGGLSNTLQVQKGQQAEKGDTVTYVVINLLEIADRDRSEYSRFTYIGDVNRMYISQCKYFLFQCLQPIYLKSVF